MPILLTGRKIKPAGFTLLELIIVMVIIGMMAMLVIPNIGSSQGAILKAQAREAMAMLKYARRSATIEGKQKSIILKEGNESAQKINPDSGIWTSRGVSLQVGKSDDDKSEKNDDKSEKNSEKINDNIKITFYPEGGSSGGQITLTFHNHTAKIEINPLTGKIKSDIFVNDDEE
ncbi:prepilin-type N-terminal cleavage/methylation domain-containing protein [Thiotrichales bacterium HSG1]|nr:prepilin-type N-terminal cleavage/methylation domain-containing protein [Thiotrichales bacterium HSG1]